MGQIIAGIGTSHVPSIGGAYDRGKTGTPGWKPLFDAYVPVREWLKELKPDIGIMVYNDHGADFFFDKYPTFAVGCADSYAIADEGSARVRCRPSAAIWRSRSICAARWCTTSSTSRCARRCAWSTAFWCRCTCASSRGKLARGRDPIAVNVLSIRCRRRAAATSWARRSAARSSLRADIRVAIIGTGGMSHQLTGSNFGEMTAENDHGLPRPHRERPRKPDRAHPPDADGEVRRRRHRADHVAGDARRAVRDARRVHRNYYAPMTTGMGLVTLEEQA